MAFDLGSIRATLGLDESNYVRGLLNAQAASEIFGGSVVNFINNPLLGTVAALKGAVVGFGQLVVETANENAELARLAESLGVSTEFLTALTLQTRRLGFGAQDTGELVGEIAIKAYEAARGSEDLRATFNKLGVEITDQNGQLRGLEELYLDVADGVARLTNDTERLAIADEIGSDAFRRMVPLLAEGSEGFRRQAIAARELGQVLQDDAARASLTFAANLGTMREAVDGVKRTIASRFLVGFIDGVGSTDHAVRQLAGSLNGTLGPAFQSIGEFTGRWTRETAEGLEAVHSWMTKIDAMANQSHDSMRKLFTLTPDGQFRNLDASTMMLRPSVQQFLTGVHYDLDGQSPEEIRERVRQRQLELHAREQRARLERFAP